MWTSHARTRVLIYAGRVSRQTRNEQEAVAGRPHVAGIVPHIINHFPSITICSLQGSQPALNVMSRPVTSLINNAVRCLLFLCTITVNADKVT